MIEISTTVKIILITDNNIRKSIDTVLLILHQSVSLRENGCNLGNSLGFLEDKPCLLLALYLYLHCKNHTHPASECESYKNHPLQKSQMLFRVAKSENKPLAPSTGSVGPLDIAISSLSLDHTWRSKIRRAFYHFLSVYVESGFFCDKISWRASTKCKNYWPFCGSSFF